MAKELFYSLTNSNKVQIEILLHKFIKDNNKRSNMYQNDSSHFRPFVEVWDGKRTMQPIRVLYYILLYFT